MSDVATEKQTVSDHKLVVERLWTDLVFAACEPHLKHPDSGNVLVAEARCGFVPMRWVESLPTTTRVIGLDSSSAMLDSARERVGEDMKRRIFYVQQHIKKLSYAAGAFPVAMCLNGIVTTRQLQEGLGELQRVTSSGGQVVLAAPLAVSFPEFYDLLDEALRATGQAAELGRIETLQASLLSSARIVETARRLELADVEFRELSWKVAFKNGQEFLRSPLIAETFFPHWMGAVRASDRDATFRYVSHAIDTYWRDRMMNSSITAGVLIATKP